MFGFTPQRDPSSLVMHINGVTASSCPSDFARVLIRPVLRYVLHVPLRTSIERGTARVPRLPCACPSTSVQSRSCPRGIRTSSSRCSLSCPRETRTSIVHDGTLETRSPRCALALRCSLCHAPERCQPSTVFRTSVPSVFWSRPVRTN